MGNQCFAPFLVHGFPSWIKQHTRRCRSSCSKDGCMKVVDEYDVGIKLHNVPIDLDAGQANELLRTLSKIRATVSSISSAA